MTPNEQKIIANITRRKDEIKAELDGIDSKEHPTAYAIALGKAVAWGEALHEAYEVVNNADLRDPRD